MIGIHYKKIETLTSSAKILKIQQTKSKFNKAKEASEHTILLHEQAEQRNHHGP